MKLRFRENSLRLRVNRREVEQLVSGTPLEEQVHFPGNARISYVLEPSDSQAAEASFCAGTIRIAAPRAQMHTWAHSDAIGIYFDLPANGKHLKIAIEKDLECIDGPPGERDPDAFPRVAGKNC